MNKFSLFLCTVALTSAVIQAKVQTIKPVQSDIFYEIARGNKKSIKTWLKSKPDLSIRNDKGQTVLAVAALTGQRDLVKMFVKAGAVINAVDSEGKTALDHAVEFGHVKMICDLVKCGGKVTTSQNLYHLKSVMKDRAFSLFVRFGILFLVGGLIFVPIFILSSCALAISSTAYTIVASSLLVIGAAVYYPYFFSLPFRAWSWNNAVQQNWMLQSGNVISLN